MSKSPNNRPQTVTMSKYKLDLLFTRPESCVENGAVPKRLSLPLVSAFLDLLGLLGGHVRHLCGCGCYATGCGGGVLLETGLLSDHTAPRFLRCSSQAEKIPPRALPWKGLAVIVLMEYLPVAH